MLGEDDPRRTGARETGASWGQVSTGILRNGQLSEMTNQRGRKEYSIPVSSRLISPFPDKGDNVGRVGLKRNRYVIAVAPAR